jgi:hypothetical protein
MAVSNAFVVGFNRAVVGREELAVELFAQVTSFYEARKAGGQITSYEHVFLRSHGGDLNGYTIVQGDPAKLDALLRSDEWVGIEAKAILYLEGFGVIRATTGMDNIMSIMSLYAAAIPPKR